jgi:hypothetical protein
MPGLVPGIHVFSVREKEDMDGRNKSGHDDGTVAAPCSDAGKKTRSPQKISSSFPLTGYLPLHSSACLPMLSM